MPEIRSSRYLKTCPSIRWTRNRKQETKNRRLGTKNWKPRRTIIPKKQLNLSF